MQTLHALTSGKITTATIAAGNRLQLAEGLTEFPREILDLADTLEVLDLSNNALSELPDDFGRLKNLRILFLSNNQFDHVPAVLADCPKLEMISFKSNQVKTVSENALPTQTRWLILTDNKIEKLPDSMGDLHRLQKLALAGNQLRKLPSSMVKCRNLELVRLSANNLSQMPDWLFQLPKLSWLAFAGNDFNRQENAAEMLNVHMASIQLNQQIGEGASGIIHHANWLEKKDSPKLEECSELKDAPIAVKLFKGSITSDGYPLDELNSCLIAGQHPNLIKVLAKIVQKDQLGLIMELIPKSFSNLGLPPSLQTCTRDTFEVGTEFALDSIIKIALQLSSAMAHMHTQGISHGDVYAHNIMINDDAKVLFGDFGAATNLATLPMLQKEAMEAIEVRALGCLMDDLLMLINSESCHELHTLTQLKDDAMQQDLGLRPTFSEIHTILKTL